MPKLNGPLFSLEARKALAKALTYQRRPGGASVYPYKKPKVPLTTPQQYQRQSIAAAVRAWQYAHTDLRALYEKMAKGRGQSGYSLWMRERTVPCGGISLYLPFIDGSGSIAHDVSGNENDGTLVGGSWTDVFKGYAVRLDKADDYINCGNKENLRGYSSFTYELLLIIPSLACPETYQWFGCKQSATHGWGAALFPDGRVSLYLFDGGWHYPLSGAGVIKANTLHYIVAEASRSGRWLWVNGEAIGLTGVGGYLPADGEDFFIGSRGDVYGTLGADVYMARFQSGLRSEADIKDFWARVKAFYGV